MARAKSNELEAEDLGSTRSLAITSEGMLGEWRCSLTRKQFLKLYNNMEITAKTVVDGRITEVIIHILDEDDLAEINEDRSGEEVKV